MKTMTLIAATALLVATPVQASTLPRVDFSKGQTMVAISILAVNVDHALTDRLSLGASVIPLSFQGDGVGAIRATYRLGELAGLGSYGLAISAGAISNLLRNSNYPVTYQDWEQIALNVAIPLGSNVTLRATVGPVFSGLRVPNLHSMFWPNAELAVHVNSSNELTLGGNSLVGFRAIF